MFGIASGTQYANAKCGNIFLFFIFDVMKKENAETVFIVFFSFKENKKTVHGLT